MSDTYTPRPETADPEEESYRRMVYVFQGPEGTVAWLYAGCEHHCEELVRLSRAVGDGGVYHTFHSEPVTCTVCWAFEHERPMKILWNQTAWKVREP